MAQPPSNNQQIQPIANYDSATGVPTPSDPDLMIAMGVFPDISHINKFGRRMGVGTATDPADVWDGPTLLWVPPTVARLHDLASSAAADASAGTGARTVRIEGTSSTYNLQTEDIILNGITNVPTINTYTRIFRMWILTCGSGQINAGDITATAQTDGTVTAKILAGNGQTLMAIYTVPAGKTGYMKKRYGGIIKPSSPTAASIDFDLLSRSPIDVANSPLRVRDSFGYSNVGSSGGDNEYIPPKIFEEKTDIVMRIQEVSANGTDGFAGFDLVIVDN